jgi:hypothetical protein
MTELVSYEWVNALVEEIEALITEVDFNARWMRIEARHHVGEMLRKNEKEHEMRITDLVEKCAERGNVGERELWYYVKLYDMFPDLALLPEGKNASFSAIKKKYLTESSSEREEPMITCPSCGTKFKL